MRISIFSMDVPMYVCRYVDKIKEKIASEGKHPLNIFLSLYISRSDQMSMQYDSQLNMYYVFNL